MRPIALGYIVVSSENLADWASYASSQLGLQRIDRSAKTLAFRMDDRKQRVVVHEDGGSTISTYGWEMADAAAMQALAARVEASGVAVQKAPRALCDERFVKDMVIFTDPGGNIVEAFHFNFAWQNLNRVNIDTKQVADYRGKLCAVESLYRHMANDTFACFSIDRGFKVADNLVNHSLVRLRLTCRRHQSPPQFCYGFLPNGRITRDVINIHQVKCYAT